MSFNQDWRSRRNPPLGTLHSNYVNMHYSIASYHSDGYSDKKSDLEQVFPQENLLDKFNMLENPLQKNLADSLPNLETKNVIYPNYEMSKSAENHNISYTNNSTLSGISNFISGVFNVITGVLPFQRVKTEYYREPLNASPPLVIWPSSNSEYLNKRLSGASIVNDKTKMSISEPTIDTALHPDSDVFEDAFANIDQVEQKPKIKVHIDKVSTECHNQSLSDHVDPSRCIDNHLVCSETLEQEFTPEIVSTCEDKLSKLKALLSGRNKPNKMPEVASKKFKNPNKGTAKRTKPYLHKQIQEDMTFADEICDFEDSYQDTNDITNDYYVPDIQPNDELKISPKTLEKDSTDDEPGSFDEKTGRFRHNSISSDFVKCDIQSNTKSQSSVTPKSSVSADSEKTDSFDEVSGRFRNISNTESEDSFQIVFADSTPSRTRKYSDCDSEDSFIIFDDNQDCCYMSTDVFGDEVSEYDSSDSESDCQMPSKFSRTVSDLTDCNLYDECDYKLNCDEIDCAAKICEELPVLDRPGELKINKKVRFSDAKPTVHLMCVWSFAARQARIGNWERHALDRERFKRRIADVEMAISWVLKPQHRNRVKFQRFMPWWNLQKRIEAEQKKEMERLAAIERERQEELEKERQAELELKGLEVDVGQELGDEEGTVVESVDSEKVDCKVDSENCKVDSIDKVDNCIEETKVVKQGYLSRNRPSPITSCSPKVFGKPFKKNNDKYGLKAFTITTGRVKQMCAKVGKVDQKLAKPKETKTCKITPKDNFYIENYQNKCARKIYGSQKIYSTESNINGVINGLTDLNIDSNDSSHETDSESEKSEIITHKIAKEFVAKLNENGIIINDESDPKETLKTEINGLNQLCDNEIIKTKENHIEEKLPNGIIKHDIIDLTNNNIDLNSKTDVVNGIENQNGDLEDCLILKNIMTKPFSVSYQINFR